MNEQTGISALSPVARKPLYERLVEHLRAYVVEAGLSAGDRLPPERELAEKLGVSRASVRQAIVALEVQGVVEVRHGEGAFLRVARLDTLPMTELMELKRRLPDILDAREAIEVKLAELAAQRRDDVDIEACEAALEKMENEIETGVLGEVGDQEFHQSVVRAAKSELLARIYAVLVDDIAASRRESLSQIGRPGASLEQHRRIFGAIRAGDAQSASSLMRDHLKTVRAVKLLSWSPASEAE
ncbi:MAG TPA: FadR/GntR family transcriptional regulator [Candidatus Saccharimonadales bacterium]|nr:FadR/GntR family transcriptional regulator [Candidatus Saccharimonadales bacterium]